MERKWLPMAGLMLLCLLWAAGWVHTDLFPRSTAGPKLSPLLSEAALLGLFATMAGVAMLAGRLRWPSKDVAGWATLVGLGLFVVPALLTGLSNQWIDDSTRIALFSATPLFTLTFEPHIGPGSDQTVEVRGGFLAALAALTGGLLIFPLELPRSYASALALLGLVGAAASVAAANCLSVRIVRRGCSALTFAVLAAGSAAILLGIVGLAFHQNEAAAVPFDAWAAPGMFALALLFWLMRHLTATQMTTRFLIAPLLANLISLAFLRPHVQVQAWIGLLMIAAGAGWLVFGPAENRDSGVIRLESK
jgi:drug/metabolite transporter (DMT)-like permease